MIRIFLLVFMFLISIWMGDNVFAEGAFTLKDSLEVLQVETSDAPKYQVGVDDEVTGTAADATGFLGKIGQGLVMVLTSVAIFMVTYNALTLVMSAGSDNVAKAKKAFIWIFLGLLSVMGAYIVVKTAISIPFLAAG